MTNRGYSSPAFSIGVLALVSPVMLRGQNRRAASADTTDHMRFACLDDGLTRQGSTGFGCQRLAVHQVSGSMDTPFYWHIMKVPAGTRAAPVNEQTAFVVAADGQAWLYSFGPRNTIPAQGEHLEQRRGAWHSREPWLVGQPASTARRTGGRRRGSTASGRSAPACDTPL